MVRLLPGLLVVFVGVIPLSFPIGIPRYQYGVVLETHRKHGVAPLTDSRDRKLLLLRQHYVVAQRQQQ